MLILDLTALQQGLIKEADIDKALYNAFNIRFELGLFDPIDDQPYWHIPPSAVNTEASQALNLLATRSSLVLLKNDHQTLPFQKGKKVAVLGPHGNSQGDLVGNYIGEICPTGGFKCITSPFTAITDTNKGGSTVYYQGCQISGNSTTGFAEAVNAAKEADYVVLLLGINQSIEREALDRVTITLPGVQEEFAHTILNIGKPTVIVLVNGGIVAIDSLKEPAPAIIEAFYPGYWGGVAIADVLFGDYNPGGKLPVTYYGAKYIDEIDFLNMNMTDAPGRSYRYYTGTPLWEFGYGLSYTTFKLEWSDGSEIPKTLTNDILEAVTYTVNITNTGNVAGDEVALAFFKPPASLGVPLIRQLFGFQRVHLKPNESVKVSFTMNAKTLAMGDEKGDLVGQPGIYGIEITNGVNERLNTKVEIQGSKRILEKYAYF